MNLPGDSQMESCPWPGHRKSLGLAALALLSMFVPAGTWGQTVVSESAEKAAAALRAPGQDRYAKRPTDWSKIPPWRQTSFHGVRAEGQFFVFVVDCSGSMDEQSRLLRAKAELRRTVQSLRFPQKFAILFYNEGYVGFHGGFPESADPKVKRQAIQWINQIEAGGETDPRAAMDLALSLKPDAVFLLSDGEFLAGTADSIVNKNASKIPIHAIDLSAGAGGKQLRMISERTGGQYAARP